MLANIAEWIVWCKYNIIEFWEFLEMLPESNVEFWHAIHPPPCEH